ncbi:MAG: helix-turn-helix domain-containing protein [Anaerolineaceae bacterium]|nr:helix-turn-helix domain-containing protein [Anaerolineaceae bacterium]
MFNKFLDESRKGDVPNKFTIYMGQQVRIARLEAHMSQRELADRSCFRQAAISEIENGKREVSTAEISFLCAVLSKPVSYFFLDWTKKFFPNELSEDEEALIVTLRDLYQEDRERILLIAKAFHDNTFRDFTD